MATWGNKKQLRWMGLLGWASGAQACMSFFLNIRTRLHQGRLPEGSYPRVGFLQWCKKPTACLRKSGHVAPSAVSSNTSLTLTQITVPSLFQQGWDVVCPCCFFARASAPPHTRRLKPQAYWSYRLFLLPPSFLFLKSGPTRIDLGCCWLESLKYVISPVV